jgi:hypothetical protein
MKNDTASQHQIGAAGALMYERARPAGETRVKLR